MYLKASTHPVKAPIAEDTGNIKYFPRLVSYLFLFIIIDKKE